jgi:hypothetical protein
MQTAFGASQQVAETVHEPDDLGDPRGKLYAGRAQCFARRASKSAGRELSAVLFNTPPADWGVPVVDAWIGDRIRFAVPRHYGTA